MRVLGNPRVYIYSLTALLACFLLKWHARIVEESAKAAGSREPRTELIRLSPVDKPAEMTAGDSRPHLFVFGPGAEFEEEMRQLSSRCKVTAVANPNEDMKKLFKIDSLPAVLLFDNANTEVARFQAGFTLKDIVAELDRLEAEGPAASAKAD